MHTVGSFQAPIHPQAPSPARQPQFVPGGAPIEIEPLPLGNLGAWPVTGVSAAWRKLLLQAEMAAPHVQVASIEGESGVGKQTLARYLLSRSPFAGSGFRRHDAREWLLSDGDPSAMRGFTYLDRVDLLAPPGQGLLLAVLKNLQDRPAGHAMLVASTQSSLRQLAGQGQLMPDLAFRLSAVRFVIAPLRLRREDIPSLAQAILERICARYQHRPLTISPSALARLLQHPWPGNVRELASVLESALLEASGDIIRPEDLFLSPGSEPPIDLPSPPRPGAFTLDEVIQRHVQYILDLNHGNKLRAARQLHISRSTLYRILAHQSVL